MRQYNLQNQLICYPQFSASSLYLKVKQHRAETGPKYLILKLFLSFQRYKPLKIFLSQYISNDRFISRTTYPTRQIYVIRYK